MKKLTVLFSALVLIGCGGGGGGSDSSGSNVNASTKVNQTFYTVDYDQVDANPYQFEIKVQQAKDGVITYPGDTLGYYALTPTKLYAPDYLDKEKAELNSLTDWQLTELNNIKTHLTFDEVSLTGIAVYNTILPGYKDFLSYLNSTEPTTYTYHNKAINLLSTKPNEKFGAGASCLRIKQVKSLPNQTYFTFNTDSTSVRNISYDDQWVNLQNLKKLETTDISVTIDKGTWNNYRWMSAKTNYKEFPALNMEMAFVEFNGTLYIADIDGEINLNRIEKIKELKDQITFINNNDELLNIAKLDLASAEQGCFIYNEAAANTIASYVK
jgi:hypothetical protein